MKSFHGRGMAAGYARGRAHIRELNRRNAETAQRPVTLEVFVPESRSSEYNKAIGWLHARGLLIDPWFSDPTCRLHQQARTYSASVELK